MSFGFSVVRRGINCVTNDEMKVVNLRNNILLCLSFFCAKCSVCVCVCVCVCACVWGGSVLRYVSVFMGMCVFICFAVFSLLNHPSRQNKTNRSINKPHPEHLILTLLAKSSLPAHLVPEHLLDREHLLDKERVRFV